MKKRHIAFITLLLVNSTLGMDGIELLKTYGIDSVAVSSKRLTLKLKPREVTFFVVLNGVLESRRDSSEYVANDEALILTPDNGVWFTDDESKFVFTPVSFKSKHKGFRITWMPCGALARYSKPEIAYIVLSDTPMLAGEDDVEMVMDNGKWVKTKDSRSLDVEKLGYDADYLIYRAERIMQDSEYRARMLNNDKYIKIWDMLIDWGVIKTNAEGRVRISYSGYGNPVVTTQDEAPVNVTEDGQDEEKSKASNLWPYALIPLFLLALLWLARKKRKRDSP